MIAKLQSEFQLGSQIRSATVNSSAIIIFFFFLHKLSSLESQNSPGLSKDSPLTAIYHHPVYLSKHPSDFLERISLAHHSFLSTPKLSTLADLKSHLKCSVLLSPAYLMSPLVTLVNILIYDCLVLWLQKLTLSLHSGTYCSGRPESVSLGHAHSYLDQNKLFLVPVGSHRHLQ